MSWAQVFRSGTLWVSLLIFGEALALLVGMYALSERGNPWISLKNDFLLGGDLITGAGLIYLAVTQEALAPRHSRIS